jgi:Primase X
MPSEWGGISKELARVTTTKDNNNNKTIEEGLDFILSHFQEPLWPRTISTKSTQGRQIIVYSKEEALTYFKAANNLDCKISAYYYHCWTPPNIVSSFLETKKNVITPSLIMIDLDRCNFSEFNKALESALRKILKRIKELLLGLKPTVIWSGNGYHIYVPIDAVVLEDIKEFSNIKCVSTKFLRFVEWRLSGGLSDSAHNHTVSINNCMLRVPGSYNSKEYAIDPQVRIIKEWSSSYRPNINLLVGSFCAYLKDQKIKENKIREMREAVATFKYLRVGATRSSSDSIPWIEILLQNAISEGRKMCIWHILAPYLINVKKLSYSQSFDIIRDWLERCSKLKRLNFNIRQKIREGLDRVGNYGTARLESLRLEHPGLYDELLRIGAIVAT